MSGMSNQNEPFTRSINIKGAGLSGLSAAIILARAGWDVHVHDVRKDSGSRFDGDFQGIENWSTSGDFLEQMQEWGLDPTRFKTTPFSQIDLIHPDGVITKVSTSNIGFHIVERGTARHTLDQGLKSLALEAGVNLHYGSRIDFKDCTIIATGPKDVSAVAYGEVFRTDHPNLVCFQLNDYLAPGAYSYLIIIDGIGLISTVLARKQEQPIKFLNETIVSYQEMYPELSMETIKRVGGKGDFTINDQYKVKGHYFVGEAGGLQDFLWGFGMSYAITSGVLAAKDILGELDYEVEIRKRLLPKLKASIANRWAMNHISNRGMKTLCRFWMWHQRRNGDGLSFVKALYRYGITQKTIYHLLSRFMLTSVVEDGRRIRRLPFHQARPMDGWSPSETANQVGIRWRGLSASKQLQECFKDDSDSHTIQ